MDGYEDGDLTEMELLPKCDDVKTEVVLLRNVEKRNTLYTAFKNDNTDDTTMNEVEWGKEAAAASDGFKCNINMVLYGVGAKIPGEDAAWKSSSYKKTL